MIIDQWNGCYDIGWGKNLVPEAFSHPAKVSFSLAGKIYDHAINMGWVKRGDFILDPFGGICGFGFHTLCYGLNFIAVELEEKFVSLGQQNIELWNRQLKGWPNLGTARIVQGDSRRLRDVVEKADLVVSSPPFCGAGMDSSGGNTLMARGISSNGKRRGGKSIVTGYGHTPGNLANMKEGDIDLVVSSPPYCESLKPETDEQTTRKQERIAKSKTIYDGRKLESPSAGKAGLGGGYGTNRGQLGSMKEGSIDAVIGSPPYCESLDRGTVDRHDRRKLAREKGISNAEFISPIDMEKIGKRTQGDYGFTEGQLGNLKEGSFDIAISSPPYEAIRQDGGSTREGYSGMTSYSGEPRITWHTQRNQNNLGNVQGDTFWSASREIVQQCYDLLKNGGHAIWVTKRYVKAGKIVEFSDRWLSLCESVGFKLVCRHQAMLVKDHGTQTTIHGDEKIQTERKSFFRRLAESKGSPKIDWEDIICLEKRI